MFIITNISKTDMNCEAFPISGVTKNFDDVWGLIYEIIDIDSFMKILEEFNKYEYDTEEEKIDAINDIFDCMSNSLGCDNLLIETGLDERNNYVIDSEIVGEFEDIEELKALV